MDINTKSPALIIADKDQELVQNFKEYLRDVDVAIKSFSSGEKVITEILEGSGPLGRHRPFLLIISTELEDWDGFSTIDIIKQIEIVDIPIVVLMKKYSLELQKQAIKRNVLCSIGDPVNFQDLKALVKKILTRQLSLESLKK
jgi:DNA-binding NtrC family response regulator